MHHSARHICRKATKRLLNIDRQKWDTWLSSIERLILLTVNKFRKLCTFLRTVLQIDYAPFVVNFTASKISRRELPGLARTRNTKLFYVGFVATLDNFARVLHDFRLQRFMWNVFRGKCLGMWCIFSTYLENFKILPTDTNLNGNMNYVVFFIINIKRKT